jgi:nucleotide-binding universal stress UspA family protein
MSSLPDGRRRKVVVGVDGTPEATRAVAWAAEAAFRWDAVLEVASAWESPDVGPESYEFPPVDRHVEELAGRRAREAAEAAAAQARQHLPAADVQVTVVEGGAAQELITLSKTADLLVVGSRGRGGFRGLLLGSVSQQCVTHAHCPVVVVRREHKLPPA